MKSATSSREPNTYRAPEVIMEVPFDYSVDIWNVGYVPKPSSLAEMISILAPPPRTLLAQGKASRKFFSDEGSFCVGIPFLDRILLEDRETTLEGQDKASLLRFIRKMLQWEPGKRSSVKELEEDEWNRKNT
ncbi:hypothetical protein IFM46972_05127 [Aspergillus udagawae]|uniref:Protein kinase domain-containing protein n=1 Tax=Aspergillus udagawae TaxID=91492 RepID=A0A8H3NNX2_9EURO|nr:hypothetical protein IFM46972_05127 [Aspergillus udagawae]